MLSAPVLIIESDDWGYGPLEQADRLRELAALLARHRDHTGHPAVMTLGVILAGPNTPRMAQERCARYCRISLGDPPLHAVREAMRVGATQGVFGLQLHGMEHFLPEILLAATPRNPSVRKWLTSGALAETEELPARLQSRWIDAVMLPSKPLRAETIQAAAREEAEAFAASFGEAPEVVVPPTFIWTAAVEQAWAAAGVRVLVTPGRRYSSRDAADRPAPEQAVLHNAQRSSSGLTYLVRDDYFEPALGHRAERALAALAAKTRLGRPTLLETHRANFLRDPGKAARSIQELDRLFGEALARWPRLRFMPSAELARHCTQRTDLVEKRLLPRLHCWLLRLAQVSRLRKLAWASGLALPCSLLLLATRGSRLVHAPP